MKTKIFPVSRSLVLKQTKDQAWTDFAHWAQTQFNVHLPKIYDIEEAGGQTFALMEKLDKFSTYKFTEDDHPLICWILSKLSCNQKKTRPRSIARFTSTSTFKDALTLAALFDRHRSDFLEEAANHPLAKTHDTIFAHFSDYGYDFKPVNIMVRPHTNELVITDPITGGPSLRGNSGKTGRINKENEA